MPTLSEILSFDEPPPPPGESPWVVQPAVAAIELVDYDPRWPGLAQDTIDRLTSILQLSALRIEHVGSTAVPGLAAKPVIDLDLTVANPADENRWLPQLQRAGFVLTVREPWWHEHRMLRGGRRADDDRASTEDWPRVNLHVFGPDSPELVKHIVFRNWLRSDAADRQAYAAVKRAAAEGPGQLVMDYNARKQAFIHDIYERAFRAAGFLN